MNNRDNKMNLRNITSYDEVANELRIETPSMNAPHRLKLDQKYTNAEKPVKQRKPDYFTGAYTQTKGGHQK